MRPLHRPALLFVVLVFLSGTLAVAQVRASKALIVEKVDDNNLVTLKGNTPPAAIAANDRGAVNPGMAMTGLILTLRRSPDQQAAFDAFVASQYDPNSPNFHHWLEPEEVGEKFGAALADIATISSWLSSHGLAVESVSKDRMAIRFGGTASQVEETFHTEIHNLMVNGEPHISNMSDPQIPMALEPVVLGPKALHNFIPRPMHRLGTQVTRIQETGKWQRVLTGDVKSLSPRPEIGFSCGTGCLIEDLTPYDFATIYNVLPLWNSGTPIDGTGQTIAVAGRSDVRATDIASFRSAFGLPAAKFNLINNGTDPGFCTSTVTTAPCTLDDQIENALDVEWSGAVAKGATVDLVVTEQTTMNDSIYDSASYIISNKTAPIINVSYGLCELAEGTNGNASYNSLWQSANSEGIAVFVATGDGGSPACDQGAASQGPYGAQYGLAVSGLASSQYDTAVGGTDLNWGTAAAPYWNSTNNTTTGATATGYIPEIPWNDTCTNSVEVTIINQALGTSYTASQICDYIATDQIGSSTDEQGALDLVNSIGGGGGASNCTTNGTNSDVLNPATCTGGYPKPVWQAGVTGIPGDSARDIPDVSFFAGNGFMGSAYLICVSDWGACVTTATTTTEPAVGEIGGTSAASPAMAGVMALINQKAGSPQGNPNAEFYALAAKQTYSGCSVETVTSSSSCYFNDIDTGTNAMACTAGSPDCTVAQSGFSYGVLTGFAAGTGFDNATGLGSLNVANVVNAFAATTGTAAATVTVTPATMSIVSNQSLSVTVAVTGASGTPTGSVTISGGGYTSPAQTLASGSATISIPGNSLSAGSDTLTASYSGDSTYATASGSATVTVTAAPAPTVTVTPAVNSIIVNQVLGVPVTVTGASGTPTGTVTLSGGGYTSSAQALASGSTSFTIPANSLTVGSVTLTAKYSGDSTYGVASGTAGVTVNALPVPTVTVTPASTTIDSGQSLTLTGTVTGSGVTPTGSVTISGGGYTGSAVTLAAGAYSITIPANSLSAGTDTLTVSYTGDVNYSAGTGTTSVTVTQSAYTLTATSPSAINPGGSASSTVSWATQTNYSGTVTLSSCTVNSGGPANQAGDAPNCTVSTTGIAAGASGTATVTTTAASTSSLAKPPIGGWAEAGGGAMLALLVFFGIPARRRGWRAMLGMLVLIFTFASFSACGGGGGSNGGGGGGTSNPGTAAGTYTFTVTGTGSDPAKTKETTTFTLTVN